MVLRGCVPLLYYAIVRPVLALVLLSVLVSLACGSVVARKYEYEEEVFLSLDGSAVVYVNASVPALVALRGATLPLDPGARLDRQDVRDFFQSPVTRVASVTTSRREGRRYVHLRLEVDDIRRLHEAPPFAWSTYRFTERDGLFEFAQRMGEVGRATSWSPCACTCPAASSSTTRRRGPSSAATSLPGSSCCRSAARERLWKSRRGWKPSRSCSAPSPSLPGWACSWP
jgi:hypothetical protein